MLKKVVACLIAFLCLAFYFNSASAEVREISAEKWLNAASFSLEANNGKIVVLEFWATWCPPCRQSIPHLKELSDKYKNDGVVFVSLTNETDYSKLEKFCRANKMDWVIGLGSNSASDYGVTGIPNAFIIYDGEVKWNGHPMNNMEKAIEAVIAEKAKKAEKQPDAQKQ